MCYRITYGQTTKCKATQLSLKFKLSHAIRYTVQNDANFPVGLFLLSSLYSTKVLRTQH